MKNTKLFNILNLILVAIVDSFILRLGLSKFIDIMNNFNNYTCKTLLYGFMIGCCAIFWKEAIIPSLTMKNLNKCYVIIGQICIVILLFMWGLLIKIISQSTTLI